MTEAQFVVVRLAILEDENRDLRARLDACNRILAENAADLPAFVAKMCRPRPEETE